VRVETIGNARLILADCRDVLPTLSGVDAVVTDPPYGIASVWKGGFSAKHGWAKAGMQSAVRNEWDEMPPDPTVFAWMLAQPQAVIWGGNNFVLPPSRGWLVWNKPERNFTLGEAELAWTGFDTVIRTCDAPRSESDR
jgi:DNA modification methylase